MIASLALRLALLLAVGLRQCIGDNPILSSFTFDRELALFTLTFDRFVDASTLNIEGIAVQNTSSQDSSGVTLIGQFDQLSDLEGQGNTSTPFIFITFEAFARVAFDRFLCRSAGSCFMTIEADTFTSPFGFGNLPVNSTNAVSCTAFKPDTRLPYVISFNMNMDTGVILIYFSEPMEEDTFTSFGLTAQELENNVVVVGLFVDFAAGGTVIGLDNFDRNVTVQLDDTTLNAIKAKVCLHLYTYIYKCRCSVYDDDDDDDDDDDSIDVLRLFD
jgi:hypothetical protein